MSSVYPYERVRIRLLLGAQEVGVCVGGRLVVERLQEVVGAERPQWVGRVRPLVRLGLVRRDGHLRGQSRKRNLNEGPAIHKGHPQREERELCPKADLAREVA